MPKNKKRSKIFTPKRIITAIAVILLLCGAVVQLEFNRIVWRELNRHSVFDMRILIVDALRGIDAIRTPLNDQNQIPEARLQLPKPASELGSVNYLYNPDETVNDGDEQYTSKENMQISASALISYGISKLNGITMNDLFDNVPEAQACSRGFTLQFEPGELDDERLKLSGSKRLNDGRTIYVYRENACGVEEMNLLEEALLAAQSY